MFKFGFYTEDKHVAEVLRSIAGRAINMECVPVVNAAMEDGTVKPATNGRLLALFAAHLHTKKVATLTHEFLKNFVVSVGRAESAYTGLRAHAQDEGLLKKQGSGKNTRYTVQRAAITRLLGVERSKATRSAKGAKR
jgi:hypothetical protein